MISVVIPVYKQTEMFVNNLKNNLTYLKNTQIIIVNDDPGTPLQNTLKTHKITLIENEVNKGFAASVNRGFEYVKEPYVLLLNSDVVLEDDSYLDAIKQFEKNDKLFSVTFAQEEENGDVVGGNTLFWKDGFMQHKKRVIKKLQPNAWAEGGSCIIRKSIFDELGGFDELFTPFYWEDIDLSYRAWKSGYQIVVDPKIQVIHHHESTIGKQFNRNHIQTIAMRNQFIFIWKNITDRMFISQHIKKVIPFVLRNFSYAPVYKGFFQALLLLPDILQKRKRQYSVLTDKKVLQIVGQNS